MSEQLAIQKAKLDFHVEKLPDTPFRFDYYKLTCKKCGYSFEWSFKYYGALSCGMCDVKQFYAQSFERFLYYEIWKPKSEEQNPKLYNLNAKQIRNFVLTVGQNMPNDELLDRLTKAPYPHKDLTPLDLKDIEEFEDSELLEHKQNHEQFLALAESQNHVLVPFLRNYLKTLETEIANRHIIFITCPNCQSHDVGSWSNLRYRCRSCGKTFKK